MEPTIDEVNGIIIITLPGESLDASNAKDLKQNLEPILTQNNKVIFDLSELRFVDSSGLGAILSSLRQLNNSGGDLKLSGITKQVRVLFELVRMSKIFDIFDTKEEALSAFE